MILVRGYIVILVPQQSEGDDKNNTILVEYGMKHESQLVRRLRVNNIRYFVSVYRSVVEDGCCVLTIYTYRRKKIVRIGNEQIGVSTGLATNWGLGCYKHIWVQQSNDHHTMRVRVRVCNRFVQIEEMRVLKLKTKNEESNHNHYHSYYCIMPMPMPRATIIREREREQERKR